MANRNATERGKTMIRFTRNSLKDDQMTMGGKVAITDQRLHLVRIDSQLTQPGFQLLSLPQGRLFLHPLPLGALPLLLGALPLLLGALPLLLGALFFQLSGRWNPITIAIIPAQPEPFPAQII